MTDIRGYYDQSYPPSVLNPNPPVPPVVNATGATAGTPGSWTPSGSQPPASVIALQGANPPVVASPATAWTVGQYVATSGGNAYWNATAWVAGAAPPEEPEE